MRTAIEEELRAIVQARSIRQDRSGRAVPGMLMAVTINWLRVSMGIRRGCYNGIEMMRKRSAICGLASVICPIPGAIWT